MVGHLEVVGGGGDQKLFPGRFEGENEEKRRTCWRKKSDSRRAEKQTKHRAAGVPFIEGECWFSDDDDEDDDDKRANLSAAATTATKV